MFIIWVIPFLLAIWNIFVLIKYVRKKSESKITKGIEVFSMLIGAGYVFLAALVLEVRLEDWNTQIIEGERHSMINMESMLTVLVFVAIGFLGYILVRFIPIEKQSPIVSAFGITGMYIGMITCIVYCIQVFSDDLIVNFFIIYYFANCILIYLKAIYILIDNKNKQIENGEFHTKYKKLSEMLSRANNLPWIGLVLIIPLLGVIVLVLMLFGQEPNSMIKAWTETADWTFSQKIPPESIPYDGHYLCTVAAGGHRKVVKPLRTGNRNGHRVLVNRQLCIANAFEQILEEKTPRFHRCLRAFYDHTGYPISKHINMKSTADIIYLIMKPLEWIFLFVIYLVDVKPEDRIAVQYPHGTLLE